MLIDNNTRDFLIKKFNDELKEDVDIKVFTNSIISGNGDSEYASFMKDIIKELSQINDKIKPEFLSLQDTLAKELNLSFSPTILIGKDKGYSIEFWGAPFSHTATALIETISLISQRKSGLGPSIKEKLKYVDKDILLENYYDANSPLSTQSSLLINKIAIELPDKIVSRSIEAEEFKGEIRALNITKLPSILTNGDANSIISGLISEEKLLKNLIFYGSSKKDEVLSQMEEEEKKKNELVNEPDYPVILTDKNFDEAIKKYSPLAVDCWAAWCAPCRIIGPIIENLARKYKGRMVFGKLNVDENQGVASRFGIMSIPTLLIFKNGEKVDTLIGALPESMLEKKLGNYLK